MPMHSERTITLDSSKDDVRAELETLLKNWLSIRGDVVMDPNRSDLNELRIVWGYAAHSHKMARAALVLDDAGLGLAARPSMRFAYECALTAHWVAQVDDALNALLIEELRKADRLADNVLKTGIHLDVDRPSDADAVAQLSTTSQESARKFIELCDDLHPGGLSAYVLYRALSTYSHASPVLSDHYIKLGDDGRETLTPDGNPGAMSTADVYLLTASVMWAARAVDFFIKGRPRRNELRAVARRLDLPDVLKASDKVFLRRAEQRRKASRTGPAGR